MNYIIKNTRIVNEGAITEGDLYIRNGRIERIEKKVSVQGKVKEIDGEQLFLLPGVIDDQVHFREPGLTHKATIATESKAALAGGVTSFMEMPNTSPPATTQQKLEEKYVIAAQCSPVNYSFYFGATNENIEELLKTSRDKVCGVKVFMGSSTGNMLVDERSVLDDIFSNWDGLIATHCEDEQSIRTNTAEAVKKYGKEIPFSYHPVIRSAEACYKSSSLAIELAEKYGSRLHVLHISTADEIPLFKNDIPLEKKKITAEVCVHHLWFNSEMYGELGALIKCNPAIKSEHHRAELWKALKLGRFDVVATDHAPHTFQEKQHPYQNAPSGLPLIQHSLQMMLEYVHKGEIDIKDIVKWMSHNPAICFNLKNRGFIRESYAADLVLVNLDKPSIVEKENIHYKCGWSPLEGYVFKSSIDKVFVNGYMAYDNGSFSEFKAGQRLEFDFQY